MELIKPGLNIDFVGKRRMWMGISVALTILSVAIIALRGGPNYGVDFTGGVMVHLRFKEAKSVHDVRGALEAISLGESNIQDYGSDGTEFLVRLPLEASETKDSAAKVAAALKAKFGDGSFEVLRVDVVGPRVGKELRQRALLAVFFSTIMMGIYIWFRFEWRFAIGAAVALMHDVILAMGMIALLNYEFDLSTVAALLTVVGFSVHDTVIVSDRIRENMHKSRRESLSSIINRSINETLSRTVLTTGTAILVVLALFFLGGNVIHGFAFTLLVGFVVGTYSSVYIASPMVLVLEAMVSKRPSKAVASKPAASKSAK